MLLTREQQLKIKITFRLSKREMEILLLLIIGIDSSKEIAEKLNIKEQTVKAHLQIIYYKMGKRTRLSVAIKALEILDLH